MRVFVASVLSVAAMCGPSFASVHRHHESRHHVTAIDKLESEIAVLRRRVDKLSRPGPDVSWSSDDVPFGVVSALPIPDPPHVIFSIGQAATLAALEVPKQFVFKPIEELAEGIGLAADRGYLVDTSCGGYTMHRQGVRLSIERLHPKFAHRLAAAFRDARSQGMRPCIYSSYRPPSYGVGGFRDKFNSAHSYGLAVDLGRIGRPGSQTTLHWRKIAAAHGIYCPYSPYSRAEWNHCQATPARMVTYAARGLRRTITARGPLSLTKMWKVADAIIPGPGKHIVFPRYARTPRAIRHRHYALRHRHVAYLTRSHS